MKRKSSSDPSAGVRQAQRLIAAAATGTALILGGVGIAGLALRAAELFTLHEVGYGDSYILYDILHLQREGYIYRDLSEPPFLPAQYSPLLYLLLALPGELIATANPFLGSRFIGLAAFIGCLAMVVSLTRKLTDDRRTVTALLTLLVAASIAPVWDWILQLRSDFIGILFSLLTLRLLLAEDRRAIWFAGLCAGMAVQMKIIFVAAGASGFIWLALRRRWAHLARFTLTAAITSAGLYVLYWFREPQMLTQMTALSPGVPEVPGAMVFAARAALEPVVVVAILTVPAVVFVNGRRWQLLLLFAAISSAVATLTIIQAGANLNYYFELFFASVPLATAGVLLLRRSPRPTAYAVALAVIVGCLVYAVPPRLSLVSQEISSWIPVSKRNAQFTALASVVTPHRTFSTIPRLALLETEPLLTEPFLLSYMDRLGRADFEPVVTPIRQRRFDALFTAAISRSYRGIPHIGSELRDAIRSAYSPYCILSLYTRGPILVHVPRDEASRKSALTDGLDGIGCVRASAYDAERW